MTVKELVQALSACDQDLEVLTNVDEYWTPVTYIIHGEDPTVDDVPGQLYVLIC